MMATPVLIQVIDAYQNAKELEITINLVKDPKNADKQWNAILLRSDIHKFFDTFQWGVWEVSRTLRSAEHGVSSRRQFSMFILTPFLRTISTP